MIQKAINLDVYDYDGRVGKIDSLKSNPNIYGVPLIAGLSGYNNKLSHGHYSKRFRLGNKRIQFTNAKQN